MKTMSFNIKNLRSGTNASSDDSQFAQTVLEGLSTEQKRLPSWLIFDDRGSEIFKEITELKNYHPSVCEFEIFHAHKQTILDILSRESFQLIELGAGDGRKTLVLLEHFLTNGMKIHYAPIDISEGAIKHLVAGLESKFDGTSLTVNGLVADYFQGLDALAGDRSNLVLFLGSTIGNRDYPGAERFLSGLWNSLNAGDYVMIGFDLMKNPKLLYMAYNDPKGVFEKFNLYLLDRINQKLGANFNKENYVQQGHYNRKSRAVESYIYSTRKQTVRIDALNRDFHFESWEGMQTEHSYKYTQAEIEQLARNNGFEIVEHLFDSKGYFVVAIWKVKK
jgi:dimethylhistidine N-methyltransferase